MDPVLFLLLFIITTPPGAERVWTVVSSLSVKAGQGVNVTCSYDRKHRGRAKLWCRGASWSHCPAVVRTDSLQSRGDVSISDDSAHQVFTVTMRNLREGDTGYYLCAVDVPGPMFDSKSVYLRVTKETDRVRTVKKLTVRRGESITIPCHYDQALRDQDRLWRALVWGGNWTSDRRQGISAPGGHPRASRPVSAEYHDDWTGRGRGQRAVSLRQRAREGEKWWCRSGDWSSCLTAGGAGHYKSQHASVLISDDGGRGEFTVTMRGLRREDEGWYLCAAGDLQIPVHLSVTPHTGPTQSYTSPRPGGEDLHPSPHSHSCGPHLDVRSKCAVGLVYLACTIIAALKVWRSYSAHGNICHWVLGDHFRVGKSHPGRTG
ncbi:hypothetical protein AGOR_G00172330 [Albula goreensis]|uniref:Ig-like domain-containing protein n=1 Tax=Albula goreensis TaxID=1534307 RepID=A0A8T3D2D7_9TELE|nr:hypothetical protein AGOR_G00172330 [Albula goreensis]